MNRLLLIMAFLALPHISAGNIASCEGLKGWSYYPNKGDLITKENSGWDQDAISKGKTTLTFSETEGIDILFVDVVGDINSSKDQGAKIELVFLDQDSVTVSSYYFGQSMELYSFWINNEGLPKYSLHQAKGPGNLLRKDSLLVGNCSYLNMKPIVEFISKSNE